MNGQGCKETHRNPPLPGFLTGAQASLVVGLGLL